jgi:phage terminase large subunit-like protein
VAIKIARIELLFNPQLIEAEKQRRGAPFRALFPDAGPHRRELYPKHLEFFEAGASFNERLFMAANRVGKTVAGAYEVTAHLTGRYPSWWQGKRFDRAIEAWACGSDSKTTYEVVQGVLMGETSGRGMLPIDAVVHTSSSRSFAGAIDTVWIKHVSGKTSKLTLKTYEQGRRSFEGAAKDLIWCDEEPPIDVYTEMMYRLLTTKGIAFTTFTPLLGRSEVVNSFYELTDEERFRKSKCVIQAGWAHVPHLDDERKQKLIANTPAYQIKARTEGEPSLGKGAIYPFPEDQVAIDPFEIPKFWPRAYGLDVGWERTACIWGAMDPETLTVVLYDEYYEPGGPHNAPRNHSEEIRRRGTWIPGVVDPASAYHQLQPFDSIGLDLSHADNNVEAGILAVFELFATGRLRAFKSLTNFFSEFRKYQRTETYPNKPLKRDDHLCDALRYLIISGRARMITEPKPKGIHWGTGKRQRHTGPGGWMVM